MSSLTLRSNMFLCVQSNRRIGACREHPRLGRMPEHVEHTEIVVRLVRLQLLQRHDQRILQQVTKHRMEISNYIGD